MMPDHAQETNPLAVRFKADHLSLTVDEFSSMTAFGDDANQPRNYVLLQRTVNSTGQEMVPEHDQVHIEINGQDRSGYGAIKQCCLRDEELRITLNYDCAKRLRVVDDIHIELTSDADQSGELTAFLAQLFANGDQFQRQ